MRLPALTSSSLFGVALLLAVAGCGVLREPVVDTGLEVRRALAGLDTREATVDGRTVAYLERGGAGPTVVLLHGFGTSKDAWVGFADALPDSFRVLAPDLAGHGSSDRDTTVAYGAPRLAAEVDAWLDAVAPGPVHVAGNSLGGEVAALLALDRPARVQSLALFGPAGVDAPEPSTLDSLGAAGAANPLIPVDRAGVDGLLALVFVGDPGIPGPARDVLAADYAARGPVPPGPVRAARRATRPAPPPARRDCRAGPARVGGRGPRARPVGGRRVGGRAPGRDGPGAQRRRPRPDDGAARRDGRPLRPVRVRAVRRRLGRGGFLTALYPAHSAGPSVAHTSFDPPAPR